MIKRTFDITARIEQGQPPFCFQAVQNDKDVYALHIRITEGDKEIDYTQVSDATITFALANGTVVQSDPERLAISSGGITYEMGTTEISCPGKVLASIQLLGEDGERLTTARFQFEVVADLITPGAVQSESRFPILQQLVADVEQLKQDIVDLQIPDNSIMDEKLSNAAGQIKQRFASHMAKNVFKQIYFTGQISTLTTTTHTLGFKPKSIIIDAVKVDSTSESRGKWAEGANVSVIFRKNNGMLSGNTTYIIYIDIDESTRVQGKLSVTDTGFTINWVLTGSPTGYIAFNCIASTH